MWKFPLLVLCVAILLVLWEGCHYFPVAPRDTQTPASQQIGAVQTDIARAQDDLTGPQGVLPTVQAITPANAATQVPVAVAKVQTVDTDLKVTATQAASAEPMAAATEKVVAGQAKQITDLQAADPIKWWLGLVSLSALLGGIALLAASVWVNYVNGLVWPRSVGLAAITFGLLGCVIWYWWSVIMIVIGCAIGAFAIFAVVWVFTHKSLLAAIEADIGITPPATTPTPATPPAAIPTPAPK